MTQVFTEFLWLHVGIRLRVHSRTGEHREEAAAMVQLTGVDRSRVGPLRE